MGVWRVPWTVWPLEAYLFKLEIDYLTNIDSPEYARPVQRDTELNP
jgi:hypothetical protein